MVKFSPNQLKDFSESGYAWPFVEQLIRIITKGKFNHQQSLIYIYIFIDLFTCIHAYIYIYIYWNVLYIRIYIYMSRDPHTPPSPSQMVPPPCGRGGGVFSAAKPIYAKYIAQCKECASNVQGTAWAALVSIHRNHGVCSLYSAYSAYSAYVSIIRMDILYVI